MRCFLPLLLTACAPDLSGQLDPGPGTAPAGAGVGAPATIDATSETEPAYLDLDTAALVGVDDAWDLSFQRFDVRVNGGVSGPGGVEAVVLDGVAYADLVTVPVDGWRTDEADADGDGVDELVFLAWYDYDYALHTLSAADRVYAVRSTEGSAWRIGFLSYYDGAGTPAMVSFDWGSLPPEEAR